MDNDIIEVFKEIKEKKLFCVLEKRPTKYMFGTNNYGEIPGTLNIADNDPWDVIVPGYPPLDTKRNYYIKHIDGVILMPNKNHKIIVDIHINLCRSNFHDIRNEVYMYRRLYNKICKKYGYVHFIEN